MSVANPPRRRGSIIVEEAYAQGKMLLHDDWDGQLPRGITPSDIDFYIDNRGDVLIGELSSSCSLWNQLKAGQRMGYEAFVMRGRTVGVLCKHSVPMTRKINTFTDIDSFSVMLCDFNRIVTTPAYSGSRWVKFVLDWITDAGETHMKYLQMAIEQSMRSK